MENLKGREEFGDLGIDGRRNLSMWNVRMWTRFISIKTGTNDGPYEHGNEPSGCIEFREYLD
jgi:hypothetical protein